MPCTILSGDMITASMVKLCITASCPDGEIRLVGTSSVFGGRVEICVEQSWTTVCDAYWGNEDASVLCRQLEFSPYGT